MTQQQAFSWDVIKAFGTSSARTLLLSNEGRQSECWTKPLLGKPYVKGAAFLIGSYYHFIVGCSLTGITEEPPDAWRLPLVPDAESLVTYYMEVPAVKAIMDHHFAETEAFAAKTLSREMRELVGDPREMLMKHSPGRRDEGLMSVLWGITNKTKRPRTQSTCRSMPIRSS